MEICQNDISNNIEKEVLFIMSRRKLLTFLGTGNYEEITYYKDAKESTSRYIQKALSDIIEQDLTIIVFVTQEAKKKNWFGNRCNYMGLKDELDKACIKYEVVDIFDGKNNEEMWANFDKIYDVLEPNDAVYIDVTHSFRSIPFIFMAVLNYGKFIKNIDVIGIFYGAYEAKSENRAPIFDLTMFNKLSDWTMSAEKLISTGDGENFSQIVDSTVSPILKETKGADESAQTVRRLNKSLKEYSYALKSARGDSLSSIGCDLKESLMNLKSIERGELKPFEKIVDKIMKRLSGYNGELVHDIHFTICLCKKFKLIQQAYTLLTENIINYVCIKGNLDVNNQKVNNIPSRIMAKNILLSFHELDGDKITLTKEESSIKQRLSGILNHDLADLYKQVSDYRNDLNHAGYRQDTKSYRKFIEKLDDFISISNKLLNIR